MKLLFLELRALESIGVGVGRIIRAHLATEYFSIGEFDCDRAIFFFAREIDGPGADRPEILADENRFITLRLSTNALRTIDKNGISAVVRQLRAKGEKF